MSSTVAAESQNKKQGSSRARRIAMGALLVVVILAAAGFAYAVVSYGGLSGVERLLFASGVAGGQGSGPAGNTAPPSSNPSSSAEASASAAQTPTVTSDSASSTLPADAMSAMYSNQLQSQDSINALLQGKVQSLQFGSASMESSSALVPAVAVYKTGARGSTKMQFSQYNGLWFFEGFAPAHAIPDAQVDPKVVAIVTAQQALPASQDAVNALLAGKIRGIRIAGVTKGAGTAAVAAVVSGSGEYAGRPCRFVFLRKTSGVNTYWFLTKFTWK